MFSNRLTVPMPTLDCSTGKAVSVFPVSQANVKNKDGNGNKRKNRGSSFSEQVRLNYNELKKTFNSTFKKSNLVLYQFFDRFTSKLQSSIQMASFVPFSRCKCLRTYYINQIKQSKSKIRILQNVS